jgi:hypothetical protein
MAQQRITFEWILEESRADFWRALDADSTGRTAGTSSVEQIIAVRVLRGLALLLVVIATASATGISHSERERREAHKGITFTLSLENEAWQRRDRRLYESLIDPNLDDGWVDEWRDYWRAGVESQPDYEAKLLYVREADGFMQATVITQQPAFEWWQTNPYREERFYRRVNQRWLRTVPPAGHWGETHELATRHLHFIYYELDAAAVEAAAPKLEVAYVEMYRTLGLPDPPDEKQVIKVLPRAIGRWSSTMPQFEVTSPLLAQIPESQSDSEYFAYEVMGWFTYRAIRDAAPNMTVRYLYRWPILVWGLRGWLRDDILEQSSPWHVEASAVLREAAPQFLPINFGQITDLRTNARPTREEVILRYLAAESFMTFVVDHYGRDRVPDLLLALVRYSAWEDIIPTVFGDSVPEFLDAWNAHLVHEYGLEDLVLE